VVFDKGHPKNFFASSFQGDTLVTILGSVAALG